MFYLNYKFYNNKFYIFFLGYLNCFNYCNNEFLNLNIILNLYKYYFNNLKKFLVTFDLRRDKIIKILRPLNKKILFFLKNKNFFYNKLYNININKYFFDHTNFNYFISKKIYFLSNFFLNKNYKLLNFNYNIIYNFQFYFFYFNIFYNIIFLIFISF